VKQCSGRATERRRFFFGVGLCLVAEISGYRPAVSLPLFGIAYAAQNFRI
jgi:hypothetical protein